MRKVWMGMQIPNSLNEWLLDRAKERGIGKSTFARMLLLQAKAQEEAPCASTPDR